jgi:hypothetical protein
MWKRILEYKYGERISALSVQVVQAIEENKNMGYKGDREIIL